MEEKEIQVININPDAVIKEYKEKLKDPNLSLINRKRYETYLKNYKLRSMNIQEKQDVILKDQSKEGHKKQQKKQTLTPKKIIITVAFTTIVATTGFNGFKLYQNHQRVAFLNSYNKEYTRYQVKYGDTLSEIVENYYKEYPEEIKEKLSVNQLANEIKQINKIKDIDEIKYGTYLVIPNKYEKTSQTEGKTVK